MLALTRRAGEEIVIGDPNHPLGVIRVVDIHGDKVRLSFNFPKDIAINRRELAEQKVKNPHPPSPKAPPEAKASPESKAAPEVPESKAARPAPKRASAPHRAGQTPD